EDNLVGACRTAQTASCGKPHSPERESVVPNESNPRPELSEALAEFAERLRLHRRLPERLIEMVRLRIAFRNQCRPCMSIRYGRALDDGLTEDLVCSLAQPEAGEGMTEREHVAVIFADRFASDHLSIDADLLNRLAEQFDPGELVELRMHISLYTGFG